MAADNSSNFNYLAERFDQPTAEAIRGLASEEALAVIDGMREEVQDLVLRQDVLIKAEKAAGSPDAKGTNDRTRKVQAADVAVKDATADPTPENQAAAAAKLQEAKSAFSEFEAELDMVELRIVSLQDQQKQLERDRKDISPALAGGVFFVASLLVFGLVALFSSLTIWGALWYALLGGLIVVLAAWGMNRLTGPKPEVTKDKQDKQVWFRKSKQDSEFGILPGQEERQPASASH